MIAYIQSLPIPYTTKSDDLITGILLVCFFVSAYILANNKKFMWQQSKNFLLHKERSSIFASETSIATPSLVVLRLQTCVLAGIYFLNYFENSNPALFIQNSPHKLLGIYIAICLVYVMVKWIVYSIIGWAFFDKSYTNLYLESYSTLIYYTGFTLFPFILLFTYFDLNVIYVVTIGLFILIFAKILIFYKWLKFFFSNIYGLLLLILYFCALEIIPCFIFYKALININMLLLKI